MQTILQVDFLVLVLLWIAPHILALRLIKTGRHRILLSICLISFAFAYLLKPSTSDLPKYSIYFDTGFSPTLPGDYSGRHAVLDPRDRIGTPFVGVFNDPNDLAISAFATLSKILHSTLPTGRILPRLAPLNETPFVSDSSIVAIMIIGIVVLLITLRNILTYSKYIEFNIDSFLTCLVIILGSLFFMIGSQNALRQFLGTVFLLLSLSLTIRSWYIPSLVLMTISALFHPWMIFFALITFPLFLLIQSKYELETTSWVGITRKTWLLIFSFLTGCALVLFLKFGLSWVNNLQIGKWGMVHTYFFSRLQQYIFMEYSGLERIDPIIKCVLISIVIVLSEIIAGQNKHWGRLDFRTTRFSLYLFTLPFILLPEVFSRIIFVFFAIELLYICWAVCSEQLRYRLAGLTVFLAYGFAPNAMNILVGRGWVYGFG